MAARLPKPPAPPRISRPPKTSPKKQPDPDGTKKGVPTRTKNDDDDEDENGVVKLADALLAVEDWFFGTSAYEKAIREGKEGGLPRSWKEVWENIKDAGESIVDEATAPAMQIQFGQDQMWQRIRKKLIDLRLSQASSIRRGRFITSDGKSGPKGDGGQSVGKRGG